MGKSIRLHPKYGLNPTVACCYFCGEEKNELALLGAAYKGEAPKSMIIDREPCEKCRNYMKQGIILMGVRGSEESRTGTFVVIKPEAVERIFIGSALTDILRRRAAFVEEEILQDIMAQAA